jgi:uncharacterized protein YndB with AHSA1/START domain
MHTVTVERTINAPIDQVFDLLTDHAGYRRLLPVIRDFKLIRPGQPEAEGLGARRR